MGAKKRGRKKRNAHRRYKKELKAANEYINIGSCQYADDKLTVADLDKITAQIKNATHY